MKVNCSTNALKKAGAIPETDDQEKKEEVVSDKKTRFIPLTDWPKHHEWPPIGGLRHLMFNREWNGFAKAFLKCGRRVLIDESEFFNCLNKHGGNHGAA